MVMKHRKMKKILILILIMAVLCVVLVLSVSAVGDVAGAVESTWSSAKEQIKTVVNHVVFPVLDMILAILFFVKVGSAYFDYRRHGQFEWAAPAILFFSLIFTLTCPLYIWDIIG